MKNRFSGIGVLLIIIISLTLLISGCSTINHLEQYDIRGSYIAMDMMIPPEPTVYVDYAPVDFGGDKLMAAVQLGTNLIKAEGADNAEEKLRRALDGLYIPEYAAELTFDQIVKTLDGTMVDDFYEADLILEIDIEKFGIEAYSFGGEVSMVFAMTAGLYHRGDRDIIWRRYIKVEREASPAFFGIDEIAGNVVTIAVLNNLSEEQLAEGFQKLTRDVMKETVNYLRDDLRKAR